MRKKIALLFTSIGGSVLIAGFSSIKNAHSKVNSWDDNWDHKKPEFLVKPGSSVDMIEQKKPTTKRTIYFVRHGQYDVDQKKDRNRKLTALGRLQAEYTGKYLANLGVKFSSFSASTMTRANETGAIIFDLLDVNSPDDDKTLEFEKTDLLREGYPIEAVPYHRFRPHVHEFTDGCRIEAAFRTFLSRADHDQNEDSHEIVVCHANVIRYFVCRVMQNPPEGWLRMSLANGSITEIVVSPNGHVSVVGIGDKSHIPVDMISYN